MTKIKNDISAKEKSIGRDPGGYLISESGQAMNDLTDSGISSLCYFFGGLVLYRMRDEDGLIISSSESAGLGPGRSNEFSSCNGDGGDADTFEPGDIVQTARCA